MSACLTEQDVAAFVAGSASPEQMDRWNRHADECESCAQRLADGHAEHSRFTKDREAQPDDRDETQESSSAGGLRPGVQLGDFRIERQLGAGGMGEVFLAQDTRLGRKVAIKLLATQLTNDPHRLRRFETEARAASGLNHPNIVTIYDIGADEAGRYIVMELVEGQTVRRLAGEPMAFERLAAIGRQIAEALSVAHAAGIVHRDIKPENVMVRDDGYVKVLDFGLVRLLPRAGALPEEVTQTLLGPGRKAEEGTAAGMLLGTVSYMSPEQARAEPMGSATDIFSLGIVLYELATGRHPFRGESNIGTLHAILSEAPAVPSRLRPDLPAPLDALLLRMLEKDARLRPGAKEVATGLAALEQTRSTAARSPAVAAVKRHTVGREVERAKLRAAFDAVAGGRGSLVCA